MYIKNTRQSDTRTVLASVKRHWGLLVLFQSRSLVFESADFHRVNSLVFFLGTLFLSQRGRSRLFFLFVYFSACNSTFCQGQRCYRQAFGSVCVDQLLTTMAEAASEEKLKLQDSDVGDESMATTSSLVLIRNIPKVGLL